MVNHMNSNQNCGKRLKLNLMVRTRVLLIFLRYRVHNPTEHSREGWVLANYLYRWISDGPTCCEGRSKTAKLIAYRLMMPDSETDEGSESDCHKSTGN